MPPDTSIQARVRTIAVQWRLFHGAREIVCGFSGGADSTALLLLLADQAPCPVTAIHLHHGLRGREADRDAAWCRHFCAERNLPFEQHALDVSAHRRPGESLETAARRCRLAFWAQRVTPDTVVALGHHLDDAMEDLFLRLGRGANSSGLTGLRPRRTMAGVTYIRPLLQLRRTDLETFLKTRGIRNWCEDRTNRDPAMRRNAVRHRLLPLFRRIFGHDHGLELTLTDLHADAACLEAAASACLATPAAPAKRATPNNATITPATLAALPPALLPRVLRLWAGQQLGRDVVFSSTAITRVQSALAAPAEQARQIPAGGSLVLLLGPQTLQLVDVRRLQSHRWDWRRHPVLELPEIGGRLVAALQTVAPRLARQPRGTRGCEYFAVADLPPVLDVRRTRPGDRMCPFGWQKTAKLKDLFAAAHVPSPARPATPVLLAGDTIIWVPGVRRAAFAPLSADRVAAVCLTFEPTHHPA